VLDISCVSVCPVDCIHYEEGTDRKLFIDPNECIDCGACEPECPVNAIFPEESLPPEWASYTQIDATWYTDKAAARAESTRRSRRPEVRRPRVAQLTPTRKPGHILTGGPLSAILASA
jgi:NAD-dependent dihydropyrimidine dehydrogenase PreA subunit